jgi:hypothetical protein
MEHSTREYDLSTATWHKSTLQRRQRRQLPGSGPLAQVDL